MVSPDSAKARKTVFFPLHLLERTPGLAADVLRLVYFDAAGKVSSVDLINPALPEERQSPVNVDPGALLFALMAAGLDPKELAGCLVVFTDTPSEQVAVGRTTASNPWEFQGQSRSIHLWPSVLVRSPALVPHSRQSVASSHAPGESGYGTNIDAVMDQLTELGFTHPHKLIQVIKLAPRLVFYDIGWLLRHPYINTKMGRESLRIVLTGAHKLCEKNAYKDAIVRGMALLLQCHFSQEEFQDLSQVGFFCQILRGILLTHTFRPPKGHGDFSIEPFNQSSELSSKSVPAGARTRRLPRKVISEHEKAAVINGLIQLGFQEDQHRLYMLGEVCDLSLEAMRWLLSHEFILTRRGEEALRMVFLGACERYYAHADWNKIVEAMEFLLRCQVPFRMKQDEGTFIGFLKLVRRTLRHYNLKEVLYARGKTQG